MAGFTSVISKMLSGSRLPPPTFRVQVTMPLCVTAMMRLATEQAFSCRVASTMWRWPTCRGTRWLVSVYTAFTVCVLWRVKNLSLPCTGSLYMGRSLHWSSCNHKGHPTALFPSLLRHLMIWKLWVFCQQNQHQNCCQIIHLQLKQPSKTAHHLPCVEESCLDGYWDGIIKISITLEELWK